MSVSDILKTHGATFGLRDNPVQRSYADHIERGIACAREHGKGQIFAEAETGTGKTIGYLVAAGLDCVANGSRAIVATHTLALQRQIVDKNSDVDDMRRALDIVEAQTGVRLIAALRIGRRNFVDASRADRAVKKMLERGVLSDDEIAELESFAEWAQAHPGEEIREFLEMNGFGALPGGLPQDSVCISKDTDKNSPSWLVYQQHIYESRKADILVTNHAMLVANALSGNYLLQDVYDDKKIGVLIVDECDKLESAARNATSDLLSLRDFIATAKAWFEKKKDDESVIDAMEELQRFVIELHDHEKVSHQDDSVLFYDDIDFNTKNILNFQMSTLAKKLNAIVALKDDDNELQELQQYAQDFLNIYQSMKNVKIDKESIIALRWSPERNYPSFRVFRLNPAHVLKSMWSEWVDLAPLAPKNDAGLLAEVKTETETEPEKKNKRACALVLTSATISPPSQSGDLNFVDLSTVYGIYAKDNPCHQINVESKTFAPRLFGTVNIVFSAANAPPVYIESEKTDEEDVEDIFNKEINQKWVDYNIKALRRATQSGGRVLMLSNSYRANKLLAEAARLAGFDPIEKMPGVNQDVCINRFAMNPDGIFITPGAWEGFDMSNRIGPDGNKLDNPIKHLIVTQIPFSTPDGPFERALLRHLIGRGYSKAKAHGIIFGKLRAIALRKFKQGFGRGIRSEKDSFTLWLTDPRYPRSKIMERSSPPSAGARTNAEFKLAIPQRFRQPTKIDSAWNVGGLLLVNGEVLTYIDAMETLAEPA